MVEVWRWFRDFERNALLTGDTERLRLARLHHTFWQHVETNPQHSLSIVNQGIMLAQELHEPCWELFHGYWRVEVYMFYLDRLSEALDSAVELMLKVQKSPYDRCPMVARIYRIMMDAYVYIDPIGYEDKILETLAYMEAEMHLDASTQRLLQARRVKLADAFDRYDEAIEAARKLLAMSEFEAFRQAHAYQLLCSLAYRQGNLSRALQCADEIEKLALRIQRKGSQAMAHTWKAILYLKQGDAERAKGYYHQAVTRMQSLGITPSAHYYDALCDYHEHLEDYESALALRDEQYKSIEGTGAFHDECEYWLKRARLLGRAGQPLDDVLQSARRAATNLQKPAHFLAKLARVEAGDYSEQPDNNH